MLYIEERSTPKALTASCALRICSSPATRASVTGVLAMLHRLAIAPARSPAHTLCLHQHDGLHSWQVSMSSFPQDPSRQQLCRPHKSLSNDTSAWSLT